MNLDTIADVGFTHFNVLYPTNKVAADIFRHYAQNELRLFGTGVEDFVGRAIDVERLLLDIIEYQRFFCWYYINYVVRKHGEVGPLLHTDPDGQLFAFPNCLFGTLIKTSDERPIGIIQYSSSVHEYKKAVEECIRLSRQARKATIARVFKLSFRIEKIVVLLEPGQGKAPVVEAFIGQYLLSF